MISKYKEILFLEELKENENKYFTVDWPKLVYDFIREPILEINDFVVDLNGKELINANFYSIKLTQKGCEYLDKIHERLYYDER